MLKNLECSSNPSRICELYHADDLSFKKNFKLVDRSLSQTLHFFVGHTDPIYGIISRFKAITEILSNGDKYSQELIKTRSTRGADAAVQDVAAGDVEAQVKALLSDKTYINVRTSAFPSGELPGRVR